MIVTGSLRQAGPLFWMKMGWPDAGRLPVGQCLAAGSGRTTGAWRHGPAGCVRGE